MTDLVLQYIPILMRLYFTEIAFKLYYLFLCVQYDTDRPACALLLAC